MITCDKEDDLSKNRSRSASYRDDNFFILFKYQVLEKNHRNFAFRKFIFQTPTLKHGVKDYRIRSRILPYMDFSLPYMVNFIPYTGIYGTVFSSLLRCVCFLKLTILRYIYKYIINIAVKLMANRYYYYLSKVCKNEL